MARHAVEPAHIPTFVDRVRAVRDWVAAADGESARNTLATIVQAVLTDCWNSEQWAQPIPWGRRRVEELDPDEDDPVVEWGESSVEVRLWRQLSGLPAGAAPPRDLSAALDRLVAERLAPGPFEDLRAAALLVADDCLEVSAALLAQHGSCRPVSYIQVAVNNLWWDLTEPDVTED
jgi:hypothetical protein